MNAINPKISPSVPTDMLEIEAAEQRRRLHNSVTELRSSVREKLDIQRQARQYVWPASGTAALVSLIMGFGFGKIFRRAIS